MTCNQTETATPRQLVQTVLMHLRDGRVNDATACFAGNFQFDDRGIRLQFKGRERLAEFFQKTRELYPDSSLQINKILVSGEYVVIEWALRNTLIEPFYRGHPRRVAISLPGISMARIESGKITEWAGYYDALTARLMLWRRTSKNGSNYKWPKRSLLTNQERSRSAGRKGHWLRRIVRVGNPGIRQ